MRRSCAPVKQRCRRRERDEGEKERGRAVIAAVAAFALADRRRRRRRRRCRWTYRALLLLLLPLASIGHVSTVSTNLFAGCIADPWRPERMHLALLRRLAAFRAPFAEPLINRPSFEMPRSQRGVTRRVWIGFEKLRLETPRSFRWTTDYYDQIDWPSFSLKIQDSEKA